MTTQEYNMLQEDDDEDFQQHYCMQRTEKMQRQLSFAQVYELNSGEDLLEALDKEDSTTEPSYRASWLTRTLTSHSTGFAHLDMCT